ncbi:MAG: hypothetical protein M1404_03990 [Acidobacteria bacterium]|nr:hypothetical protein [Acidobacteriota bacterium]
MVNLELKEAATQRLSPVNFPVDHFNAIVRDGTPGATCTSEVSLIALKVRAGIKQEKNK